MRANLGIIVLLVLICGCQPESRPVDEKTGLTLAPNASDLVLSLSKMEGRRVLIVEEGLDGNYNPLCVVVGPMASSPQPMAIQSASPSKLIVPEGGQNPVLITTGLTVRFEDGSEEYFGAGKGFTYSGLAVDFRGNVIDKIGEYTAKSH